MRLLQSLGSTWRVLHNETARQVHALEQAGARDHADFGDLIAGTTTRDHCYAQGDWQHGMASLGPSIAFAQRIEPLHVIVNELVAEAVQAITALPALLAMDSMDSMEKQ